MKAQTVQNTAIESLVRKHYTIEKDYYTEKEVQEDIFLPAIFSKIGVTSIGINQMHYIPPIINRFSILIIVIIYFTVLSFDKLLY